ncbi:MAG: transcription elongation factor GreA [Clostridiaceae bacterium BRH_c20a]|nr:MAG: transcription elongation factor GreA [Clostridiaceae bacterium BRH_c20a]
MAEKEVMLTRAGLARLEEELDNLRIVKRKEVAERIKQAIEFGDISENSEYEDAKNEQAFIEGRIITIEKMLRNAKVIEDDEREAGVVSIGSTVTLKDIEFDEVIEYKIVGSAEADPLQNLISNESPVGRSLLGKKEGNIVDVDAPVGKLKFQVLDISNK